MSNLKITCLFLVGVYIAFSVWFPVAFMFGIDTGLSLILFVVFVGIFGKWTRDQARNSREEKEKQEQEKLEQLVQQEVQKQQEEQRQQQEQEQERLAQEGRDQTEVEDFSLTDIDDDIEEALRRRENERL